MSGHGVETRSPSRGRAQGATVWFVWMVAMWVGFFVLLATDRLGETRDSVRDLHVLVELVVWLALLPWMLGAVVWTSSWADWLRVGFVACLAAGWTLASVPRTGRPPEGA